MTEEETVTMVAPFRSSEQKAEALAKANAIRGRRAEFKREIRFIGHRDLREAALMVAELIEDPPAWAASWRAQDLLLALPKWGEVKVKKVLRHAGVAEVKRIGGLSDRQRRELAVGVAGE